MSNHIALNCAHCQRSLRIRKDYRGQRVICNHCGHAFLAEEPGVEAGTASAAAGVDSEVRDPRTEIERLKEQIAELRHQAQRAEPQGAEVASARKEHSRLVTTVQVLKTKLVDRVAEVERLKRSAEDLVAVREDRDQVEGALRAARAEADELRARLEDERRLNERLEARHQAACIEHARQNEDSFRLWEIERQELISGWRQELRLAREQAAQERNERHAAALDREQDLQAQLATERHRFEQEAEILRARIDALENELDAARGKRDQMPENVTNGGDELHALKLELRIARHQASLALQRDEKLIEQLQLVQTVLEGVRAERGQIALDLAKARQEPLVPEPAPAAEDASLLRHELARLQEDLDRLQQQRDQAIEQAAALRLDRDRLHDSAGRLEVRLQEAKGQDRAAFERLEQESNEIRRELAGAHQRESELRAQVETLQSWIDRNRADDNLRAAEWQEEVAQVDSEDHTALSSDVENNNPGIAVPAEGSEEPATATSVDASPSPPPIVEPTEPPAGSTAQLCGGDEGPVKVAAADLPRPEPLSKESPEARIHRLRRSLRASPASGSEGPFFARLRRILERTHAER
jgi:chromosome segregation ATPase